MYELHIKENYKLVELHAPVILKMINLPIELSLILAEMFRTINSLPAWHFQTNVGIMEHDRIALYLSGKWYLAENVILIEK